MGEQLVPAMTSGGCKTVLRHHVIPGLALPLSSVGEYCDSGNEVVFGKYGGIIRNLQSGAETYFPREHGIYVLDMWIPNPAWVPGFEASRPATPGFTRQGLGN